MADDLKGRVAAFWNAVPCGTRELQEERGSPAFFERLLSGHAIQCLKRRRIVSDHAREPSGPRLRFRCVTGGGEGPHREGGVARPAVTIIPVAVATDLFRQ